MNRMTVLWLAGVAAVSTAGAALASGGGGGGMGGLPSMSAPAYDPAEEYTKAVTAMQAHDYRNAERALNRVTDAAPQSVEAWRLLGDARQGQSNWKGAQHAYEKAVKLAPDDYISHAGLGLALANQKDAKAQAQLDWLKAKEGTCQKGCPDEAGLKAATDMVQDAVGGQTATGTGTGTGATPPATTPPAKPSAAIEGPMMFASAKAGDVAYDKAVGLINAHRYDAALASLKEAEAAFGPHPDIITYEGYAWRKKGDYDRAERYYTQALAIAPAHRGATEYYGELKVERGDMAGARALLARLDGICVYGCAEAEELRRWVDLGHDPLKP